MNDCQCDWMPDSRLLHRQSHGGTHCHLYATDGAASCRDIEKDHWVRHDEKLFVPLAYCQRKR